MTSGEGQAVLRSSALLRCNSQSCPWRAGDPYTIPGSGVSGLRAWDMGYLEDVCFGEVE